MTTPAPASTADLLTESEAVERIGGRAQQTRKWLRDRNLVRDIPGLGRRVVWGDVLDEARLGRAPDDVEPEPVRLPRAALRPRRVK